jgi:hypothetical protein
MFTRVQDAVESKLESEAGLTAPLVRLVLDYWGRSPLSFKRWWRLGTDFERDAKRPEVPGWRDPQHISPWAIV